MTRRERLHMRVDMFKWNMRRLWNDRHHIARSKKLDIRIWYKSRKIDRAIKKYDRRARKKK